MSDNQELLLSAISDMLDRKLEVAFKPVREDIHQLQEDVVEIKADIVEMKADIVEMKADIYQLQEGQKKINLIIENEIRRDIRLLTEILEPAAAHYISEAEKIQTIESDVKMLKHVVAQHSVQLEKIS